MYCVLSSYRNMVLNQSVPVFVLGYFLNGFITFHNLAIDLMPA